MKGKLKTVSLIPVIVLSFFFSGLGVNAQDVPGDSGCTECTYGYSDEHHIDYDAIEQYTFYADHARDYYDEQVAKNPFSEGTDIQHVLRRASVTKQGWAGSNITRYYQDDYNDLLCPKARPLGPTIKSAGCVITSFSMIVSKYGIVSDPLNTRTVINRDSPGTENSCSFPWFDVVKIPFFSSLKAQEITRTNWASANTVIEGAILQNRPVIVYMTHPSKSPHAVVVYGYEYYSDGGVFHYLFNPSKGAAGTLEDYKKAGYSINRIMVYYK